MSELTSRKLRLFSIGISTIVHRELQRLSQRPHRLDVALDAQIAEDQQPGLHRQLANRREAGGEHRDANLAVLTVVEQVDRFNIEVHVVYLSAYLLHYLARYTHRVAISNHRLVEVTDANVTFRWKDYARHNKRRIMTLTHEEFLRLFLQHVLPRGFPRIRYFGFLANRRRGALLPICRMLLAVRFRQQPRPHPSSGSAPVVRGPCALSNA